MVYYPSSASNSLCTYTIDTFSLSFEIFIADLMSICLLHSVLPSQIQSALDAMSEEWEPSPICVTSGNHPLFVYNMLALIYVCHYNGSSSIC